MQDNAFGEMTLDQWNTAVNVKVTGTKNLWEVLSGTSALDFFVMLSSLTSVTGNQGQANYSAGNSFQDALLAQLSKILSYELADLDPSRPLNAYGVDSLVAVELRVWMSKEIGADISVFDITSGQRIKQLAGKVAATSRFRQTVKEE